MKVLIIGTYLPRQCGIATFTHDLYKSLIANGQEVDVLAMIDQSEHNHPKEVKYKLLREERQAYKEAAAWINAQKYDACILQHEFGIFDGDAGNYILELINELEVPLISNLHTVLEKPSVDELAVIQKIAAKSDKITVMTKRAITMLNQVYHVPFHMIQVIPHGIPNFKISAQEAKEELGLEDKTVMLSFGLLGRNKGYEVAIDAVSQVKHDNFVYIILGATHPNVLLAEGESYKNSLMQQAADLGLNGKVLFVNKYASDKLLQTYLKACDIYVTPYPNENQISSGTLTFALGAGAAVLSTPYWYAVDLLAEGKGKLFDFNNANQLALSINQLLEDPLHMASYREKALAYGKTITWKNIGKKQIALIHTIIGKRPISKSKNIIKDLKNQILPMGMKLISQRSIVNN
ncbi:glycosyltransferase [Sphingobacterium sp. CZ-2]|uniref:glycosyltransferase n=1 Tax=Sphingobacterium sp. CZ-2 TaxID=2557994 RepID=UPI00107038BF|nr:glycosyltransferase [Sphingobacterium sp. CZ-2]QBR12842.1 glycosyltransferase [Sphingobacterium sp. CZ-2]